MGNLFQNTIQAIQAVLIVGNQLRDLLPLEDIVLGADMAADLSTLQALMQEAVGLGADVDTVLRQLTSLFGLGEAPRSSRELRERLAAIRRLTLNLYGDALRTQALLQSSLSALRHLVRLIDTIGVLVGNKQANQTLAQMDVQLTIQLTKLKEQTAAFHRAQIVDAMAGPLIQESIVVINDQLMQDYP